MSMSETPTPEPKPYKLFRMGSYVGDDLMLTFHMMGPGQLCANLAESHVGKDGKANLNSMLVIDTPIRDASAWEVRKDEDNSSAACVVYLDAFPAGQLAAFAKLANTLTLEVWAESCTVRIEHSYKRGKPVYAHEKPVRWWSSQTGYRDVPYAEFVRIHGEAEW